MSLLFNMLHRFVIAFFPRSKHLLIKWLQPPSAVILESKKIKSVPVSTFPFIYAMKWSTEAVLIFYVLGGCLFEVLWALARASKSQMDSTLACASSCFEGWGGHSSTLYSCCRNNAQWRGACDWTGAWAPLWLSGFSMDISASFLQLPKLNLPGTLFDSASIEIRFQDSAGLTCAFHFLTNPRLWHALPWMRSTSAGNRAVLRLLQWHISI